MKRQYSYILISVIAWLIAVSCANIVTPTGGDKDVDAPKVVSSEPLNGTKEFGDKNVKITFDEFVKLTDVSKEVIISPFTFNTPDIKTKGKSVVVEFSDSLRSNTTYSIAFGNSIADITEGNIVKDYRFVFSTGPMIDTLQIKGVVKNALSLKPESGIFVMLYTQDEDSIPLKETPYYLARTGDDGAFTFSSIRSGRYKIFALKDANADYIFDQPNEKIAFLDTLIKSEASDTVTDTLPQKKAQLVLNLFEEKAAEQKLLKTYPAMYGKVNLVFRKPLETFTLKEIGKARSGFKKELNKTRDTLSLWMNNPDDDSLFLEVSENGKILDTAETALIKKGAKNNVRSGGIILSLRSKNNVSNKSSYDYFKPVTIDFSNPILKCDFSKILIVEDTDTILPQISMNYSVASQADSILRKFIINNSWKEGTNYSIQIFPAAFRDVFNLPNDTIVINFKTAEQKDYGNIKFKITGKQKYESLLVQLVNNEDAVLAEKPVQTDGTVKFDFIRPAAYRVKLIADSNSNGEWDTGNYLKHRQPEKVYYNPSPIEIKANWDIELEWLVED